MLKLYYARPSAFARPVWLALIEKQLPFELVPVDLSREQFTPEFLELNPFGHIPVLIDGDFKVIESLAILDYLEAKYPTPSLLPTEAIALTTVRMVQSTTAHELIPALIRSLMLVDAAEEDQAELTYWRLRVRNTLRFLQDLLGDKPYFAGEQLTLAEIMAGTLVYRAPEVGIPLSDYPKLNQWSERLVARPSWQQIELSSEEWSNFKRRIRVLPKLWERQRRQRLAVLPLTP